MTRKGGRLFALWCTGLATLAFVILTVDSHDKFPTLTNSYDITEEVKKGKHVWHKYNCINCHTLFGEGAYYAPDLTKIAQHRGEAYLKAYMKDPSQFYDEKKHRRLMPRQNLSETEIADLVKFLEWVSKVDNQGWPPRPILVTGASIPGTDRPVTAQSALGAGPQSAPGGRPVGAGSSPIAQG
ncbi:MAG TPA: cytochrome c, partial [Burkholderiales bacterium]|nr:cytochrome c [Burkholderiales bacterium]